MNAEQSPPFKRTPLAEIIEQIDHGPYEAAPDAIVFHYLVTRHQRPLSVHPSVPTEKYISDIQHQWQHEMHSKAVENALEDHRITAEQAGIMYDRVLWPWSSMVSWPE